MPKRIRQDMMDFSEIMTGYMDNRFQLLKQIETNITLHLLIITPQYPVFYKQFFSCFLPFSLIWESVFFSLFDLEKCSLCSEVLHTDRTLPKKN